jgi:hypothetical protein
LLLSLILTACAITQPDPVRQEPNQLVGSWRGWLITPRSFTLINLHIGGDASFELTGEWGIRSTGILVARGGTVWFDGSRGWRGTLNRAGSPEAPVLKLERWDRLGRATLRLARQHG